MRYDGEKALKGLSEERRKKSEDLLAGVLLTYLAKGRAGPIVTFVWKREDIEALVEGGVLTKEEVQLLLRACRKKGEEPSFVLDADELTEGQKEQLVSFAFEVSRTDRIPRKP